MKGAAVMEWGFDNPGELATTIGKAVGYIAAGVVVSVVAFYRTWSKLKLDTQTNESEAGALKLLDKAVEHWKDLNTEAWAQVKKERELRIEAERRADVMAQEMEGMRLEISRLRREVEGLRNVITVSKINIPPEGEPNAQT